MDDEFSGTIIAGRYRIVGTIGRGGMGRVYKAVDMRFGRFIALKVLEFLQETQRQNLAAEATILKQLSCPNIVQIYEYDQAGNSVYLATEYVEGRSMAQILAKGKPLDVRCAVEIAYQVGRGLDCVHRNGFVHRDVKPSNILISNYGRVLLADFGLATRFGAQLTEIGTVKGTPVYMSPEQVMGRSIDARSDIFSLGTVTYESITGQRPFQGKSAGDLVQNLVETDPAPPRGVNPLVDPGLEAVVLKALAKDPERRFSSMQLFLEALQPFRLQIAWTDDGGSLLSKLLNAPADPQETAPAADITEFLSAPLRSAGRFPLPTVPGSGSKGAEQAPAPESRVGALRRPAPRLLRRLWPIALACIILVGIAVAVMPLGKIGRSDRGSVWGYLALLAISLIVALLWFAYRFGVGRLHYDGLRSADAVSVNEPKHPAASHVDLLNRIVEEGSAGQSNSGEADLSALSQREFFDPTTEIIPYTPSTELSKGEPSAMAWLLVLNGRLRGRQFRLTDTFTIGRSSSADFSLFDDTAVSRQHARIALENGRFYIYDCGSKTATMLNGAGVCNKQELRDRDEIRIGHTNMLFIKAVSPEDLTTETKRRLRDFDAIWEELTRSVRHD